jgi:hypothetical protein
MLNQAEPVEMTGVLLVIPIWVALVVTVLGVLEHLLLPSQAALVGLVFLLR